MSAFNEVFLDTIRRLQSPSAAFVSTASTYFRSLEEP